MRKIKLTSQQFVIRMDTTFTETLMSITNKANKDITTSMKCNQCDYANTGAGKLRTHLKSHSGEKPHKCNLCDYSSVRACNMRQHLKIHTGEKSYKCNQCDFASSGKDRLKRHSKTHSGENRINATFATLHLLGLTI